MSNIQTEITPKLISAFKRFLLTHDVQEIERKLSKIERDTIKLVKASGIKPAKNQGFWFRFNHDDTLANTKQGIVSSLNQYGKNRKFAIEQMWSVVNGETIPVIYFS
jgi:hypothetical protein